MTIQNPPIFIQAGSHPAEDVRRWIDATVESTAGVVAAGDLAVTENGTPNMSVEVAAGRGFVAGDEATYQGMYAFENRGTTNVVIAASDPTNPRIDLIVVRVRDSAYSGATDTVAIEAVTGTPAAVPVAPTEPDNCLVLAQVAVAALATSIVDANITDQRTRAYSLGVASLNTDMAQQSNRMAVYVEKSVAQNVANNTEVALTWDVEVIDTDGIHSNSVNTSRLTIPSGGDGLWSFGYHFDFTAIGTGSVRLGVMKKNLGGTYGRVCHAAILDALNGTAVSSSALIRGVAGDYFEVYAYQNSGGALGVRGNNVLPGISAFWATRLGD